ncbi:MAG: (d)CMP kinase, partial [Deltaproteobacteria bacterium]|nr:(d)CMP kinase [Deltaproteobacteria bacterium]
MPLNIRMLEIEMHGIITIDGPAGSGKSTISRL